MAKCATMSRFKTIQFVSFPPQLTLQTCYLSPVRGFKTPTAFCDFIPSGYVHLVGLPVTCVLPVLLEINISRGLCPHSYHGRRCLIMHAVFNELAPDHFWSCKCMSPTPIKPPWGDNCYLLIAVVNLSSKPTRSFQLDDWFKSPGLCFVKGKPSFRWRICISLFLIIINCRYT